MSETREQRELRLLNAREAAITELETKYPDLEIRHKKFGVDLVYYVPSYSDGKIHIGERTQSLGTSCPNLDGRHLTKGSARFAISQHLPAAKAKFDKCNALVSALKVVMEFDLYYNVEGDTHGINSECLYIAFREGDFDFRFELET